VIFAPAPPTMVTAKRRECQSGAPIGYRSEAFRHYELQTVPCPCRPNLSRLGELRDKIGWCVFERRRSCTDAQPGEYYLARLKSYPPWPSIICDEEMLPDILLNSRPVTTKKADGTYNEAYADGGKKVADRTFPIMFLHTNEL